MSDQWWLGQDLCDLSEQVMHGDLAFIVRCWSADVCWTYIVKVKKAH
jgi:hypothetical protein